MAQRRHHYEQAFEEYLRARRIPYVAVDEARKALLPPGTSLSITRGGQPAALKSFDFVIYGQSTNLLLEVKGRRVGTPTRAGTPRLECWVTQDDVDSLRCWERLFGEGFSAAFLFVYWCELQPPDALFQEIFEHRGRWYALRVVHLEDYAAAMKVRSPRWRTFDIAPATFTRISHPFAPPDPHPLPMDARGARYLDEACMDIGPELPAFDRLL